MSYSTPYDGSAGAVESAAIADPSSRAAMELMAARVVAARNDPNAYIELVGRADGGHRVKQGPVHREWQQLMSDNERLVLFAAVGSGKLLPLDTEIPTPDGFRRLGDLQLGDFVFDQDGHPTTVEWLSDIQTDAEARKITFADGVEVTACVDHEWSVVESQRGLSKVTKTKTTQELQDDLLTFRGAPKWRVPVTKPVQYPQADLPIHPYVLGCWLGDGTSSNAELTCHDDDAEIVDRCIALELGHCGTRKYQRGTRTFRQIIGGCVRTKPGYVKLRTRLNKLGLINNKHIPEIYLTASVEQRKELLAGLLDTDGTVSKDIPRIEFCSVSPQLAADVYELTRSLGFVSTLRKNVSKLQGVRKKDRYRVCWSTKDQVFWMKRKRERHEGVTGAYAVDGISIVKVEPTPSVPMRCIGVDSPHHTYLFGRSYTVTHNSNQIRWRIEWELGRNPNLRIGLVSSSQIGMPAKLLAGIRATIESSRALRYVFPELRPSTVQKKWGDSAITVARADNSLDPSVQIFGPGGKILGSRLDLIIVDDLCNHDNTRTEILRDKMYEFVTGPMLSRFSGKGGRVWFIGNTWHGDDVLHRLERTGDYAVKRYSAFKPHPEIEDEEVPTIPELWTIEKLRAREKALGARSKPLLRNILLSQDETRIKEDWIRRCLDRGRGLDLPTSWNPADAPTFTGVDLGVGNDPKHGDLTAIFTLALLPDGSRRVLDIRSGRWTGPKTLEEITKVHHAYGSIVYVENNGQQAFLHQFASQISAVPLKSHTTTQTNKYDFAFGIESLGVEFSNAKWVIPSKPDGTPLTEELSKWLFEAGAYTPSEHPGDRLIASWIAREAARKFTPAGREVELYDALDTLAR